MTPDPVDDLFEQLSRGQVEALGEVVEAYTPYLRAVVRTRLSDRLRAKFDSLDVVQSVWVQVIRQIGRDGWRVNGADHLRALLVTIARRRLATRARQCGREGGAPPTDEEMTAVADHRHAPPGDTAQANDLWQRLLLLTPPEHRPVLLLKREGLSVDEIAARTGLHAGSVRRIFRRLARALVVREGRHADGR